VAFVIARVLRIEQIAARNGEARRDEAGRMIGFRLKIPVKIDPAVFQSHSF
jgi:hypothetical protein